MAAADIAAADAAVANVAAAVNDTTAEAAEAVVMETVTEAYAEDNAAF